MSCQPEAQEGSWSLEWVPETFSAPDSMTGAAEHEVAANEGRKRPFRWQQLPQEAQFLSLLSDEYEASVLRVPVKSARR